MVTRLQRLQLFFSFCNLVTYLYLAFYIKRLQVTVKKELKVLGLLFVVFWQP